MTHYNPTGFLTKDDIIKAQQRDIDRLHKEIEEHCYIKEMHRKEVDRLMQEQLKGYTGPTLDDIMDSVARTGAHEAGYWVTRALAHIMIATIAGCFIGFILGHYTK